MKYQQILSKAWEITWNQKYLWLFGFLAGLTLSSGNNDNSPIQFGLSFGSENASMGWNNGVLFQGGSWLFQNAGTLLAAPGVWTILMLVVSLLLWVVGVVARSGLIHQVNVIEAQEQEPGAGLGERFRAAFQAFPPALGMQLLIWSPILALNVMLAIASRSVVTSAFSTFPQLDGAGVPEMPGMDTIGAIGALGSLGCVTALLTIPLTFIDGFAYRSIILEKLGVIAGLRRALQVIKENIGPILVLSIICLLLAAIVSVVVGLLLSPFLMILAKPMMEIVTECSQLMGEPQAMFECIQRANASPRVLIPSLLLSILGAAFSSVWITFQSATFTLAYRRMTGKPERTIEPEPLDAAPGGSADGPHDLT